MDKMTSIRIKLENGTYSEKIPLSVLATNINWDNTHSLVDVLGNVDLTKGNLQAQIDEKINVQIDDSLSIEGDAADAKIVGDNFAILNNNISALETNKQNILTFDTAPASGSTNPVTSGGIKAAINKVEQTCSNISTELGKSYVSKNSQNFTNEQKEQIRKNIGLSNGDAAANGFNETVRTAFLNALDHLVWDSSDPSGQTYIDAIREAITPKVQYIIATFETPESGYVQYTAPQSTVLEQIKKYLTVIAKYTDGSQKEITENYSLSASIAENGLARVIAIYQEKRSTPFQVMCKNKNNLLYDWNFKTSLFDKISYTNAQVSAADGVQPPARTSEGVVFNAPTQRLCLGSINMVGKTIEFVISQFNFVGNTGKHCRLLMNQNSEASNAVGAGALIFRSGYGWSSYGYTDAEHTEAGYRGWSAHGWGNLYNPDQINFFNNKTVRIKYCQDGFTRKLYVDGELIATMSDVYFNNNSTIISFGGGPTYSQNSGDQCYNMTISAVRIYNEDFQEEGA